MLSLLRLFPTRLNLRAWCIFDCVSQTVALFSVFSPVKHTKLLHCEKVIMLEGDKSSCFAPFFTFNLFLFLVYIFSFRMLGRKMYKCQGTTETAITAVCSCVNCRPPFARNIKITVCDTQHAVTAHPPAKIPEHLSQQGSATSLLMSRHLSSFLWRL